MTSGMTSGSPDRWYAVTVRSRHEKSVKTILEYHGYRTSLPLRKCLHKRRTGSEFTNEVPLISGYVFVGEDTGNFFHIVTAPGVVSFVGYGSGPCPIAGTEIAALERVAASQLPVSQCGYTRIGEVVRLVKGPLKGLEGIVMRESKSTRLVVSVDLLQRSLAVEIDGSWAIPAQYSMAS